MNKTITIRPISMLRFVWLTIWIFFISLSGAAIIVIFLEGTFEPYKIIIMVCAFIMVFISSFFFFADFKRGIKFDNEGIKVSADKSDKRGLIVKKFQYALYLEYKDINGISIDFSKNDTHNKEVQYVFIDMPNIILTLKNGGQERINVYYYSLKQKIKIIDVLKCRIEKAGNYLDFTSGKEIWEKAYSKTN